MPNMCCKTSIDDIGISNELLGKDNEETIVPTKFSTRQYVGVNARNRMEVELRGSSHTNACMYKYGSNAQASMLAIKK